MPSPMILILTESWYGVAQPPCLKSSRGSSSFPPGACITPSRVRLLVTLILRMFDSPVQGLAQARSRRLHLLLRTVFHPIDNGRKDACGQQLGLNRWGSMRCAQCEGIDQLFDSKRARRQLAKFRRKGADR